MILRRTISAILFLCICFGSLFVSSAAMPTDGFAQNDRAITYSGKNRLTDEFIKLGDAGDSDITLKFKLTAHDGNMFAAVLRYFDENKNYLLQFDFSQNEIRFLKKLAVGKYTYVSKVSYPLDMNVAYDIGIVCADSWFELSVNDKSIKTFSDGDIKAGAYGFYASDGEFVVTNLAKENISVQVTADNTAANSGSFGLPKKFPYIEDLGTERNYEQIKSFIPEEIPLKKTVGVYGDCEIFVATDGSDISGDGSIEKPFATLNKALKSVDYYKKLGRKRIVIYMRGGSYPVSEAVILTSSTSGTDENPLIISSYNNEDVEIMGGYTLKGSDFKPINDITKKNRLTESARDKVMVADLNSLGISSFADVSSGTVQLYVDNTKMTLARYPNASEITIGRVISGTVKDTPIEIGVTDSRILAWENTGDICIYGSLDYEFNRSHRYDITINPEKKSFRTEMTSTYGARYNPENTYYFYNVFEEIDTPGEWYLDRSEGKLYFYPYYDINDMELKLSLFTNELMSFKNASNVVVNDIHFNIASKNAVSMVTSKSCMLQNCIVSNGGGVGLYIDRGSDCGIIGSTLYGFAGDAYVYVTTDYFSMIPFLNTNVPQYNFVQNNLIYNSNDTSPRLIWNRFTMGTIISHNLVSHAPAGSIYVTRDMRGVVEYNEITGGPNQMNDMGAIYTNGVGSWHTTIRNNYLHDGVKGEGTPIYIDEMANSFHVYNNLIKMDFGRAIFIHSGSKNTVANNIVVCEPGTKINDRFGAIGEIDNHNGDSANRNLFDDSTGAWMTYIDYFKDNESIQKTYPDQYAYLKKVYDLKMQMKSDDYVRGEEENYVRAPMENVYMRNVIIGGSEIVNSERGRSTATHKDNLALPYEDIGFKDLENHDFRLNEDARIYSLIPGFEDVRFERMGLVSENGMWEELPELTKVNAIAPMNGEKTLNEPESIMFKWSPSIGADNYTITIANDPQFKEVILEDVAWYPEYNASLTELGHKYYWRVTANASAKSLKNKSLVSDVFSFETMTEEEYAKYSKPDKYNLEVLVGTVENFYNNITEGTEGGQYKPGTIDELKLAVNSAREVANKAKRQNEVDTVVTKLTESLNLAKTKVNPRFVYLDDFNPESWTSTVVNSQSRFKKTSEGMSIDAFYGGETAYTGSQTGLGDIYCFRMKVDNFTQWMGILPRHDYMGGSAKYWNIMKPDLMELQYYLRSSVFLDYKYTSVFSSDEWHEVQIGSVPTDKGIWNVLIIDGQEIFNYIDAEYKIYADGWLTITVNEGNGNINLAKSEKTYTELPAMPAEVGVPSGAPN